VQNKFKKFHLCFTHMGQCRPQPAYIAGYR